MCRKQKIFKETIIKINMGRIQVVLDDEIEKKFRDFLAKQGMKKGTISEEIETYIRRGISEEKIIGGSFVKQDSSLIVDEETKSQVEKFFDEIKTLEKLINKPLILLEDKRINAVYTECHVLAETLIKFMDLDPSIDPDNQEEFRSNRAFEEDNPDYLTMVEDAKLGRQFSDLVIEFNPSKKYKNPDKPLKVFGGQHRCHAIMEALKEKINHYHGIRVYFNLDIEQRVNIAIVSNRNINVSDDLLDRMDEQSLEPPNKLREYCYEIGILNKEKREDFSSKRSQNIITVGLMRTFIINFYRGKNYKGKFDEDFITPVLAGTNEEEIEYKKIYKEHKFLEESDLIEAGKEFIKLHKKQKEKGEGKAKMLTLTFSITSSWSFTAGLLRKEKVRIEKLYKLPELSDTKDPLKSEILANTKGEDDPENYRGLITRYGAKERGRLLQLFLIYSKSPKGNITKDMVKLAIEDHKAKEKAEERKSLAKKVY